MFPNPNWSRWISASFSEHFRVSSQSLNFPLYVEGQVRDNNIENYAQLRFGGPYFNELNKNYWRIEVIPYIFIHTVRADIDIYRLDRLLGSFTSYFLRYIPVYRYGDDDLQFGCMIISNENIRTNKFGQATVATPIQQATIEARYFMTQEI